MNSSAAGVWLDAWEHGMSVAPALRPAVLLEAFHGPEAEPTGWSLGRREAALLRLRRVLFGETMESLAACPQCGEMVEFTLNAGEMLAAAPSEEAGLVTVAAAGLSAEFRLPDTLDLEAATTVSNSKRRRFLLERCLVEAPERPADWPEDFIDAASRRMAEADPLGDVDLRLSCPACAERWNAEFDAGAFLWAELSAWASRLMSEIHLLAVNYGWTEADILQLPPHRRGFYLERLYQS